MSNPISALSLLQTMQPTRMNSLSAAPNSSSASALKPQAGLFDNFLSQAEKDFLSVQLEQIQRFRQGQSNF